MKSEFSILAAVATFMLFAFTSCSDEQKNQASPAEPEAQAPAPTVPATPAPVEPVAPEAEPVTTTQNSDAEATVPAAAEESAPEAVPEAVDATPPEAAGNDTHTTAPAEPADQIDAVLLAVDTLALAIDKDSADAAAEEIAKIVSLIDTLSEPTNDRAGAALGAILALSAQIKRLETENFFGSDALREALSAGPMPIAESPSEAPATETASVPAENAEEEEIEVPAFAE